MSILGCALNSLNELIAVDPEAVQALIYHRVPCNQAMADHPTAVCDEETLEPTPEQLEAGEPGTTRPTIGMFGLLQSIIVDLLKQANEAPGRVAYAFDDTGTITGFVPYKAPAEPKITAHLMGDNTISFFNSNGTPCTADQMNAIAMFVNNDPELIAMVDKKFVIPVVEPTPTPTPEPTPPVEEPVLPVEEVPFAEEPVPPAEEPMLPTE